MAPAQRQHVSLSPWEELLSLTRNFELWSTLAWSDTKLRYRRTKIGPLWVSLSTGLTVLMVGMVYGGIFGTPTGMTLGGYIAFFACGLVIWTFISSTVTESCTVFVQAGPLIKALPVPLLLHVFRMMARNLVLLGHNVLVIVILWLVTPWALSWSTLLVVPGFILLFLALVGVVLTLSVVCARFRDIQQIVGALLQLMFLLTPIIWPPEALAATRAKLLLVLNPVYYLIEVVRGPLLGTPVDPKIWGVAALLALVSFYVGLVAYGRYRHRIAYWL